MLADAVLCPKFPLEAKPLELDAKPELDADAKLPPEQELSHWAKEMVGIITEITEVAKTQTKIFFMGLLLFCLIL